MRRFFVLLAYSILIASSALLRPNGSSAFLAQGAAAKPAKCALLVGICQHALAWVDLFEQDFD
jgi:hypothetical protein